MSGGNLLWEPAFPTAPSCQLPFLKGREVMSKLSLFFSRSELVCEGSQLHSITAHYVCPGKDVRSVWDIGSRPWSSSLGVPGRGPAVG